MIKVVLFDLDDTLFPEANYIKSGFGQVEDWVSQKYKVSCEGLLWKLFSQDKTDVYNRLLANLGLEVNQNVISQMVQVYRNHLPKKLELYEDSWQVLTKLKQNGIRLGIITDGRLLGQKAKIKALEIESFFDKIIITDELGGEQYRKPDQKAFCMMKDYFDVSWEQMVYIGDNKAKDFVLGGRFPINTIEVARKDSLYAQQNYCDNIKPTYVVESLENAEIIMKNG